MTKQEFVAKKVPILMKEGKYSRQQAYQIAFSMFEKEGRQRGDNYAQQGRFNQPVPQNIGYTAPNLTTLPSQGYDFSYTNNFNPQPVENNTSFGQNQFSNSAYSVPSQVGYSFDPQKSFANYNQTQNNQEASNPQNPYTQNSVNILNPYGGISMEYALNFAGEGFGSKDYGKAAVGTGLSLLKGARNFLTGFSTGRENQRVGQEYDDKRFDKTPNYTYSFQQGGVKNSDIIAQNAIVDQGQGNVNLEGKEFVMRNNGQVQPVVGDKHIENGKKADGVNAQLEDGDKVLSNYVKLKPNDIKDLKERYDISLKKGVTFAEAQKKLDQKLGIKKLETEKADILEKIEKATKIKDSDTKQLSLEVLTKKTGDVNEKLNTLSGIRADNFEYLFQKQESQPKLGNGSQLFDKNGKEVTETKDNIAQQGGIFELANKYGISPERAQELIAQQGGQMEQGQVSPEQIISQYAQLVQQDPQQIVAQLQKMSPEEQQQAIMQMSQALQQGQQSPQEEQAEGQMSNPQEEQMEAMQYGGRKEYMQSAGEKKLTYEQIVAMNNAAGTNLNTPSVWTGQTANEFYNPYSKWETYLGRTPRDIKSHEIYQKGVSSDLNPQISQLITSGEMPLTNKHRELLKKAGVQGADKITNYTSLSEADRNKLGQDFVLSGYTDTLAGHRGVSIQPGEMTQEEYAQASGKYNKLTDTEGRQIYAKYDDKGNLLKDDKGNFVFYYPKKAGEPEKKVDPSKITDETKDSYTEQPNQEVESRTNVKNVMPNFGSYIPLFSPMSPIAKETINIPRMDAIKTTAEPYLAEQERQRLTDVERIEQAGMSPQQTEALLAQGLSSSQMASNDAIAKVEQYNAQNQFQADQYNLGARSKEDIMNAQFRQDYQGKALQTLANQEESMRNQYRSNFLQEQANSNKVINMNTANALNDNFAVTPSGVEFLNNKPYELPNNTLELLKNYDKMTPAERIAFIKSHSKLA